MVNMEVQEEEEDMGVEEEFHKYTLPAP